MINLLRLQNDSDLYLNPTDLENADISDVSPNAKSVVKSIVSKLPLNEYYVVNREILKSLNRRVSYEEIDEIISALSEFVENQYTMNLGGEDDRKLFDLLVSIVDTYDHN